MATAPSHRAETSTVGWASLPALADRAALSGPACSGVTHLVIDRAATLAARSEPVLVLHREPAAARRTRAALIEAAPHAAGNVTAVSTAGLARDLLERSGDHRRVLAPGERARLVEDLLVHEASHRRDLWPASGPLVGTPAFAPLIGRAVDAARSRWVGSTEIDAHEQAVGGDGRWAEAVAFGERLTAHMLERGVTDRTGLIVDAVALLRAEGALERWRTALPHLLVDDVQALDPASHRLLLTLATPAVQPPGTTLLLAGHPDTPRWPTHAAAVSADADVADPIASLGRRLAVEQHLVLPTGAATEHPGGRVLVCAHHPSLEADAAVGVLLDATERGVDTEQLAVIVPDGPAGRALAADITRAASRHALPVHGTTTPAGAHPMVAALHAVVTALALPPDASASVVERTLDPAIRVGVVHGPDDPALRAIHGVGSSAATRAFAAWSSLLAPTLVHPSDGQRRSASDDRALDAIVAYVHAIDAGVDPGHALDAPVRVGTGGVTVTTASGTVGARWHTVVVCGALEGTLPRTTVRVPRLDPALLDGPDVPGLLTRHRRMLDEESRRWAHLLARSSHRFVAIAAPRPGELPSRFVEGWEQEQPSLRPGQDGPPPTPLVETVGPMPVWPTGSLRLSATQLTTFANCPLDYAYQYGVGVRSEGGVPANVGTIVHEVLEHLLDPAGEPPTRERMLELLDRYWDPSKFDYRPQEAQYAREVRAYLEAWWTIEGSSLGSVVAVEHRFSLGIGPHTLTGSIDRVNLLPGGDFEVVDYKTGSARSQAKVDDDLQLRVYHLAARRDPALRAHGEPKRMRLLFLKDEKKGPHSMDLTVTEQLVAETEAHILGLADTILAEGYEASVAADCDWCSFKRLCPLQVEGRETR